MKNATSDDMQYIAGRIREDFDTVHKRFRSEFHRYEYCMELIERARRLGLTELAEEMRADNRITT